MKKIFLISIFALFTFCAVERDNPLDQEGESYTDPSFTISNNSIGTGSVNSGNDLIIDLDGNTNFNVFQYKIDNGSWSSFSEDGQININDLLVGPHEITLQTKYPDNDKLYSETFKFLVVSTSSIFMTPAWVTTDDGQTAELHCQNIPEGVVTMHVKFNNVLIESASLTYSTSANVKLLHSDSIVDIAVLPGGESLSGSKSIASLSLKDFTGATVYLNVDMRDKNDSLITCDSTFGLIIK